MKTYLFSLLVNISSKCHPGPLWMNFWCSEHIQMHLMGSKKTPWNIQGASKTFKCEPSGSKNPQREQGDIHGQPRVLQNDPKDSKSELQGTSNSKKLILNNQKRHLIHFQPTVHPRLQESNYRLKVGGRGEACKFPREAGFSFGWGRSLPGSLPSKIRMPPGC